MDDKETVGAITFMSMDELMKIDPMEYVSPAKTLRDEFAIAALAVLAPHRAPVIAAAEAYAYADAMLKAREQK